MGEDVVCLDNLCQGMRGNDMKMEISNNNNNKTTQEVEKKRESKTTTIRRTNVSIFINYMLRRPLKSDNRLSYLHYAIYL